MNTKSAAQRGQSIRDYFRTLIEHWGPQDWWPAHTRFEVILGAYLTQNTAWANVELALRNLRQEKLLNLKGIRRASLPELERLVRPAGYFRQKARRLKNFVGYLDKRHGGSLTRMFSRPTRELREELLELNGVGPETADSILLYAGGHPVFVVDAYTRRVFERHAVLTGKEKYEEIRELFENALGQESAGKWQESGFQPNAPLPLKKRHKFSIQSAPKPAQVFDEYHALLVRVAKNHCLKKAPFCQGCPLEYFLPPGGPRKTTTR
jgi:endonuclease-3 related protein